MHARSRIARLAALSGVVILTLSARPALAQQASGQPTLGQPVLAQDALASQALSPRTPPADVTAPARTAGPTAESARAGVTQQTSDELRPAAQTRRAGFGQPVALMVVGGAALLTGLIIGGDAGTVIAVGGALVGLYGLYQYLQ
ncbi:MAG TPA: hypothetical protein VFS59_06175 [Gemmatimonadaceae bacterium]|nr:hypothetical protein [Gemmatimonadaceae bacterium]